MGNEGSGESEDRDPKVSNGHVEQKDSDLDVKQPDSDDDQELEESNDNENENSVDQLDNMLDSKEVVKRDISNRNVSGEMSLLDDFNIFDGKFSSKCLLCI